MSIARLTGESALKTLNETERNYLTVAAGWNPRDVVGFLSNPETIGAHIPTFIFERVVNDLHAPAKVRAYCACRLSLDPLFGSSSPISDRLTEIVSAYCSHDLRNALKHPYGYARVAHKSNSTDNDRIAIIEFCLFVCGFHPEKLTRAMSTPDARTLSARMGFMQGLCTDLMMSMKMPSSTDASLSKYFMECVRAIHFVAELQIFG
jgi:hypothetical protein